MHDAVARVNASDDTKDNAIVFDLHVEGNMKRAVEGQRLGTFIAPESIAAPWA